MLRKAVSRVAMTLAATLMFVTGSVTDGSVNGYGSIEYDVTDSGTMFLASSGASGEPADEMMGLTSPSHTLGYRHVW